MTDDSGDIVGTVTGGYNALASTLNNNDGYGTIVSSVPLTTITTDTAAVQQQQQTDSGNAAPAATAAPYVGGLVGAGMMVVGLL